MRNKDVVASFLDKRAAKVANLHTDGDKLFSYYTCIAQWCGDILVLNKTKYSITTSQHQSLLTRAINTIKIHTMNIDEVPRGTVNLQYFIINYNNKHEI